MRNLARSIVWSTFKIGGKPEKTFRISETYDFADINDETFLLPEKREFGIVHPLDLDENSKTAWKEIFADYGLIFPFSQIDRTIYRLESKEKKSNALARWKDREISASGLLGHAEKYAWEKGPIDENEEFTLHLKQFPGFEITVVLKYEPGIARYDIDLHGPQKIRSCKFVSGLYGSAEVDDEFMKKLKTSNIKPGEIHPILISETINEIERFFI